MNRLIKLSLVLLGTFTLAGSAVFAADTAPATTPAPAKAGHAGHGKMLRRAAIRGQIAKRLDLSTAQRDQLKTARANTAASLKAIRADASLTPEQKKAKVRETVQAARTEMKNVLTPEQQKKLHHLQGRARRLRAL